MFVTPGSRATRKELGGGGILPIVGNGLTVAQSTPLLDLSQTWNNTAVAFTGLRANFTDAASAFNTIGLDLRLNNTQVFGVQKHGETTITVSSAASANFTPLLVVSNLDITVGTPAFQVQSVAPSSAAPTSQNKGFQLSNIGAGFSWASFENWFGGISGLFLGSGVGGRDAGISRIGSGQIKLGIIDNTGTPIAQTLSVQNVANGGTNVNGSNWTRQGSMPTGTGIAGNQIISNAFAGLAAAATQTFTVTLANPAIFTAGAAHGYVPGQILQFTTTGALPTGLSLLTNYYVLSAGLTSTVFEVSATPNGTPVATSGAQSGIHTATPQVTTQNPASTVATFGPSGLTGSQTTPALDMFQTWNTTGVAEGFRFNVNNVASANNSPFLDIQSKGVSMLSLVSKNTTVSPTGSATALIITAEAPDGQSLAIVPRYWTSPGLYTGGGGLFMDVGFAGIGCSATTIPFMSVGATATAVQDILLTRDAAGIIGQRAGTTPQGLRIYNTVDTWPTTTNYERLVIDWTTTLNTATVGIQAGGTGNTGRSLNIVCGGTVSISAASNIQLTPGFDSLQVRNNMLLISNGGSGQTPLVINNAAIFWAPTNAYVLDIGINRAAGSVLQINNGSSGVIAGAYLNWGGEARTTANFTSSTSTLTAITGLSSVVIQAGHNYSFEAWLAVTGSSLAGVQVGITCSSTTITTLLSDGFLLDAGVIRGSSVGVISSTGTPVTAVSSSTVTSSNPSIRINGMIRVASSGLFGLTVAQSTASGTQTIVSSGSWLLVYDMP